MNTNTPQTPSIGRIVHYVAANGVHWAAIVTWVHHATMVNLYVFPGDGGPAFSYVSAAMDPDGKAARSWHWCEPHGPIGEGKTTT